MNVTGIIVTRGDHNYAPCLANWPLSWERIVWDNSGFCRVWKPESKPFELFEHPVTDLSVYGRYAAIEYASHDLIYVQDDDVIVSDPQAIVREWQNHGFIRFDQLGNPFPDAHLVANMPQEFRHDGYTDSCLVGFGACFHRDAPTRAFRRFWNHPEGRGIGGEWWDRTCDVVFTTLTPRVLVDVPKTDREFASDTDRMWKQPTHYGERTRMLELARQVRDS